MCIIQDSFLDCSAVGTTQRDNPIVCCSFIREHEQPVVHHTLTHGGRGKHFWIWQPVARPWLEHIEEKNHRIQTRRKKKHKEQAAICEQGKREKQQMFDGTLDPLTTHTFDPARICFCFSCSRRCRMDVSCMVLKLSWLQYIHDTIIEQPFEYSRAAR